MVRASPHDTSSHTDVLTAPLLSSRVSARASRDTGSDSRKYYEDADRVRGALGLILAG
jgi:hypothetical protein